VGNGKIISRMTSFFSQTYLKTALSAICWLSLGLTVMAENSVFQNISFEAALKQAGEQHKIVLIDFFTIWCGPCKLMDATTWRDPAVISLLNDKVVALQVDAEKETALADKFSVNSYPTMVMVKPDGTVLDTLSGYLDAKTFIKDFNTSLAGKTSLARAQEAVEKAKDNPDDYVQARYALGQELMEHGKFADALSEFLWCYDDGMKKDEKFGGVRSSFLLSNLALLRKLYPPTDDALKARLEAACKKLAATPSDASALRDITDLNHVLGDDQATLAYFDKLPPESPQRSEIGIYIFPMLLDNKRYKDAVSAQPFAKYKDYFKRLVESLALLPPAEVGSMKGLVAERAAAEVEALAGAGDLEDARSLTKSILAFDKSDATLDILRQHLARAGHSDILPTDR
jgi:thioredoxin-related protein